jgi:hypothetical protein
MRKAVLSVHGSMASSNLSDDCIVCETMHDLAMAGSCGDSIYTAFNVYGRYHTG